MLEHLEQAVSLMKGLLNRVSGATSCKEKTDVPFCPGILQLSGSSLTYQHRGCPLNKGIMLLVMGGSSNNDANPKEKRHIVGIATQNGALLGHAVISV